ncbi:RagB/SusD family nutrient uptake outer membrane protein [Flavobacteriaceae bacterium F08102]|nr:RagB/SusD family nutrient uptake outer membrane protein [Flavobacteriaceae bacterium F08102]
MKKFSIKFILLTLLVGLYACDSQLDLAPTDIIIEEQVFADEATAETALADSYYQLFLAATGPTFVIADASLPYVGLKPNSTYLNYTSGTLAPTDYEVNDIWSSYYKAINVSNVFIDKIPIYGNYNEDVERQHIAEAKFTRAFAYLGLLVYYGDGALTENMNGQGLPLRLKPYEGFDDSQLISRSTNGEVYTQIIKDLTEAIPDLPESYSDAVKNKARATKAAAYGLLSRVYLYMGEGAYQDCVDAANEVLNYPQYKLDPDLLNLFPLNTDGTTSKFSDEVLFGFPTSSNKGNFQFGTNNIGYYNKYVFVDSDFIESIDPNDKRRTELIVQGNPLISDPVTKFEKTTFKFNNPDGRDDVIMIRLAEVLLNKAEALVHLNGINSESVKILNDIRERSNLDPILESDFNSPEELLTALYDERYIETAFEGRARFDFIRTQRPLRNPNLEEDLKVFPIPQREIDISKGILTQNQGYN